jgi:tetratricopeptide (TPR) repeat protein
VTPGEILPARELLGDMLVRLNQPEKALQAYTLNLQKHPNRFNGLYGAAVAAEKAGVLEKAVVYYRQLVSIADSSDRVEIKKAKSFLERYEKILAFHLPGHR